MKYFELIENQSKSNPCMAVQVGGCIVGRIGVVAAIVEYIEKDELG